MLHSNNLILQLLHLSKDAEGIPLQAIVSKTKLTPQTILQNLKTEFNDMVEIKHETVSIPKDKKMRLVIKAISSGIGMDRIIETLHWREFENFCLIVFDYHNFRTVQNFYYSYRKKRHEIDVLAMQEPLLFAIDAKKWNTGRSSALKPMVKNQIARAKALGKALRQPKIRQKLPLVGWRNAEIIPMIVTSKAYEIKIFQEVPIIPFFKLNQFLTDYHRYREMILHLSANFFARRTRPSKNTLTHFMKVPLK